MSSKLLRVLAVPLLGLVIPGTALAAGFGIAPDAALPTVGVAGIALVTWRAERRREVRRGRRGASSGGADSSIRPT